MKKIILAGVSAMALASGAFAAETAGEVSIDVTKDASGNYIATPSIDLAVFANGGSVAVGLTEDNGSLALDGYRVGVTVGTVDLSFGDQGDVFDAFEGGLETVGGTTLANPDDSGESLIAKAGVASVAIGLTDISADITDVKNVQVAFALPEVANLGVQAGVDYNLDSEDYVLGAAVATKVAGLGVGGLVTYGSSNEVFGYELSAGISNVTAFVDGDSDDALQNVGVGYTGQFQSMNYYAEAAYNIDAEEFTPAIGVAFSF